MHVGEFVDGALMFRQRGKHVSLVQHDPLDFPYWEYHELIAINCFPCRLVPFFAFSFSRQYCFCYHFSQGNDNFAVVVVTSQHVPQLYWQFFRDLIDNFDASPTQVTPECRYTLLLSLIGSWRTISEGEIFIQSSSEIRYVAIDRGLVYFGYFNPFAVIDCLCDPLELWRNVIRGYRIRVVGKSANVVSYATFGLTSLTCPFPYRNGIVLATSDGDPRVARGDCRIVGYVVDKRPPSDGRFVNTLWVSTRPRFDPAVMGKQLAARAAKFSKLMDSLIGISLIRDPYSDALLLPFTADETMRQIPPQEMEGWLTLTDWKMFEQPVTVTHWRTTKRVRKPLRGFFLSILPQTLLETKSEQQLIVCADFVREVMEKSPGDRHFLAVLARHEQIIQRRLRTIRSSRGRE
jgi:hypothetical protein